MIWLIAFYWVCAGIFTAALPTATGRREDMMDLFICFALGGFALPAYLLHRVLR